MGASLSGEMDDLAATRQEGHDLIQLLDWLVECRPAMAPLADGLAQALHAELAMSRTPHVIEQHLERFSRDLRALWLRSVAAETARVLRSPTEQEEERMSAEHDSFGYERDLQPQELEARCDAFYGSVPEPWRSEHLLFSSGQAALSTVLLAFRSPRPLRVQHLGGYFETRQLIQSCPSLCALVEHDPDIVIAEPIECDGRVHIHDNRQIARAASTARAVLIDTTFLGRIDRIGDLLPHLDGNQLVVRLASGLKLLQGGLELANVGIVGTHSISPHALAGFTMSLREMRTLCGSGLRFADVLALEAPFVFDGDYTDRYANAVFEHNAALAEAVASRNRLFAPPFNAQPAPYCVFALRSGQEQEYERLADVLACGAKERNINLARGGSFGFRGHRYEIVRPEHDPPFLRVAMGRRGGWSARKLMDLLADVAGQSSI